MYSLLHFGRMITDKVRMDAYAQALERAVRPGSVVVDIGAGTGIFSLMACQLGAARVYAIDPSPYLNLGKTMATANGYADRIIFIKDFSTHLDLPEQADVLIGDVRGPLPILTANISILADARRRMLKPGGLLIPQRDVVYATLISAPEHYHETVVQPWLENAFHLDMSAGSPQVVNTIQALVQFDAAQQCLPPRVWVDIDYRTREDPIANATLEWVAEQSCTAHYVHAWFDATLLDEIGFTTAPIAGRAEVYGYLLLPLQTPLEIAPGDKITLDLKTLLMGDNHMLLWNTTVQENQGRGRVKASFRQSTFYSAVLDDIHKSAVTFSPVLAGKGQITRFILNAMDSSQSIEAIARSVIIEFPRAYKDLKEAINDVAELSQRYSQ